MLKIDIWKTHFNWLKLKFLPKLTIFDWISRLNVYCSPLIQLNLCLVQMWIPFVNDIDRAVIESSIIPFHFHFSKAIPSDHLAGSQWAPDRRNMLIISSLGPILVHKHVNYHIRFYLQGHLDKYSGQSGLGPDQCHWDGSKLSV